MFEILYLYELEVFLHKIDLSHQNHSLIKMFDVLFKRQDIIISNHTTSGGIFQDDFNLHSKDGLGSKETNSKFKGDLKLESSDFIKRFHKSPYFPRAFLASVPID